ncbi:hypothetical protein B7494_g2310 [Chlorociboria aeruginascens]|nr:hypothetical protein B7494_g2310 [Chlorociboria aeruginascens]
MPPTKRTRTASGLHAKGAQKTLAFGNTRVTKPVPKDSKSLSSKAKTEIPNLVEAPQEEVVEGGNSKEKEGVNGIEEKEEEEEEEKNEEEQEALRVTDSMLRKYWRGKEELRIAPRVHQADLKVEEKICREWDLSSQFGPSIGMTRLKRWNRAHKLGLQPPIEVLAVLLREEKKGNAKIERSHVDELMSSKFGVGEA